VRLKTVYIILGCILNALIRMMDKAFKGFRGSALQCFCQSAHGQTTIYVPAQVPLDALPAVKIQDNREIDMLMLKLDISDIRNPSLVQPCDFAAFKKVWIEGQTIEWNRLLPV